MAHQELIRQGKLEKLQCQLFPLVESSDMEKAIRDFDRIALGNANQN